MTDYLKLILFVYILTELSYVTSSYCSENPIDLDSFKCGSEEYKTEEAAFAALDCVNLRYGDAIVISIIAPFGIIATSIIVWFFIKNK